MIAEDLIEYIKKNYPGRVIEVGVSEDGENGAILIYKPYMTPTLVDAIL